MFHTVLCDLLGIKYPIIQGAMGGKVAGPRLVAAVSNAGGLGVLASYGRTTRELREEIRQTRDMTDKPFGVNLFAGSLTFCQRVAELLVEEGVTIATTGRGDPTLSTVALLKQHKIKVMPVVPTVRHALRLEAEGADVIIASGTEAGGHVGTVASLPLIPMVVDAVKVPVVAAGGIGDARGFVAALALGACGIQMGTVFLATHEADTNALQKQKLIEVSEEDTMPTTLFTGKPVRVIKTAGIEEWERLRRVGAPPEQLKSMAQVLQRKRDLADDPHELTVTAGQIVGMIKKVVSVEELMGQILDEAQQICARLGALAPLASTR